MARWLRVTVKWTGAANTRQTPAKIKLTAAGNSKFVISAGIGYVVAPGGGTSGNDAERLMEATLTQTLCQIRWGGTGGQTHVIKVKFASDAYTEAAVSVTGPIQVVNQTVISNEFNNS